MALPLKHQRQWQAALYYARKRRLARLRAADVGEPDPDGFEDVLFVNSTGDDFLMIDASDHLMWSAS